MTKSSLNDSSVMFFYHVKIFCFWIHILFFSKVYFKFEFILIIFNFSWLRKLKRLPFINKSKYPSEFINYFISISEIKNTWLKLNTKNSKSFIHFIFLNMLMPPAEDFMLLEAPLPSFNSLGSSCWVLLSLNFCWYLSLVMVSLGSDTLSLKRTNLPHLSTHCLVCKVISNYCMKRTQAKGSFEKMKAYQINLNWTYDSLHF